MIKTLGHKFSGLADDLIGIQPRVHELENLLKLSSEDDGFRVLGVWGMGGIGKTVHATVLYDRISYQFDACCFIENVSQIYKDGGAIAVQKQILRQTLDEKNLETYSPSEISGIVRNRLHSIKVLVVLDNVDQLEQLKKLAIIPKLLCAGSRIIITTRDEHILKVYGVDEVHKVPLLNNYDAHKLFCRIAFKSDDPGSRFVELTYEVLKYAQGLPLAIRVVGSFLCTRDAIQWRDALDRLGNNPDNQIMDVLRISFEELQPEEKEIFLHIACFFKGEREDYVKRILDGCGLHPHIGIPVIIEKSLITIRNQEIHMHEMLQELGKKIVRDESLGDLGSRSRMWLYQDFHHVLTSEMGTNKIKAIVLHQKKDVFKYGRLQVEELSKIRGLELLILYQMSFSGSLNYLSNSLRCLLWHGYPFTSLPLNFQPNKLVELNMSSSSIERLWEGSKDLPSLKRLDLNNSKYLMETPNFEGIPSLERLDLTGCKNLTKVHPSIGLLKKLAFLSLRNCSNMVSLYLGTVSNLSSLRVLYLSGCTKLEHTPDFIGLSNLEYLDLEQCISLSTIHESIGALMRLKFLSLRHCTNLVRIPSSVNTMRSLITLDLSNCLKLINLPLGQRSELEDSIYLAISRYIPSSCLGSLIFLDVGYCNLCEVPDAIAELRCLERLNLQGNHFGSVPDTINGLFSLAYLNLSHCHGLQYLPLVPSTNASLVGRYFGTVSGARNHRSGLYVFDCPKLVESELNRIRGSELALAWLTRLVEEPRHFRCGFDIVIHGSVIPKWFNHQFIGGSVIRIVHSDVYDNWIGFAFCVAFEVNYRQGIFYSSHDSFSSPPPHPLYLSFESEHAEESFGMPLGFDMEKNVGSKYIWLIYISRPHCHFVKTGAHITFKASPGLEIRQWGIRVIFKQDIVSKLLITGEGNQGDHLHFDYVREAQRWRSFWLKIQLPYNWLVTEEEEIENMEAKEKENNLSAIGL